MLNDLVISRTIPTFQDFLAQREARKLSAELWADCTPTLSYVEEIPAEEYVAAYHDYPDADLIAALDMRGMG